MARPEHLLNSISNASRRRPCLLYRRTALENYILPLMLISSLKYSHNDQLKLTKYLQCDYLNDLLKTFIVPIVNILRTYYTYFHGSICQLYYGNQFTI